MLVATRPPGRDSERTATASPDPPDVDLRLEPPAMTPPGAAAADRDSLVLIRDGARDDEDEPVEIRLGARETLDSDPELDDELDPPLELLEPELPPELDPDDPEDPDDPDDPELELPRGTACAPARLGAASANATTRLSVRRVDLAMVVTPEVSLETSSNVSGCNSTATRSYA